MPVEDVWKKPRLRTDEEEGKERRTTWLELFFDLVYVTVIRELARTLSGQLDADRILTFVLLFIPAWWLWIDHTVYNNRFDRDDVSHRLFTFVYMLAILGMAFNVYEGLAESSRGIAISYAVARVILIFMWLRAGWHNPVSRPMTNRYAVGFSVAVVFWIASVFVARPVRFVLWGIGLLVELLTPVTTMEIQERLPRLSMSHLPERFGLFTIIVLGDTVIEVARGITGRPVITVQAVLAGFLGLTLAFSIWWIYFDYVLERNVKAGVKWLLVWSYLHLPLLMGLTAIGVGTLNVIISEGHGLPSTFRWLICLATAVTFLAIGIIELSVRVEEEKVSEIGWTRLLRFASAGIAILLGWLGGGLNALVLLTILVLLGIGQVIRCLYRSIQTREC